VPSSGFAHALVLGGIRSGKSEFAESLVAAAGTVHYLATARRTEAGVAADPGWAARIEKHRARRSGGWTTTEVGGGPLALLDLIGAADSADTLLVDDLGNWVAGVLEVTTDLDEQAARLAAAVRACRARLVLVSPEVGLSVVPATESGRVFADALGATNRAIADACDALVLVIAGNAMWLKGGP
jgi:nicotinate-nucleotide--dimethylbenzimidazole phosphoribosyltransferase